MFYQFNLFHKNSWFVVMVVCQELKNEKNHMKITQANTLKGKGKNPYYFS